MKDRHLLAKVYHAKLRLIEDPVLRAIAAWHVWWDFFSAHHDPSGERFGFKKYLRQPIVDFKSTELAWALRIAGYSRDRAVRRARRPYGAPPYGQMKVKVYTGGIGNVVPSLPLRV